MSERAPRGELKNIGYEIFIGILSVLSILNIVLLRLADDPDIDNILRIMNGLFSGIFLIDFMYRIITAPSRSDYFLRRFGWADLLASLPLANLKFLRIFRLVRVYRPGPSRWPEATPGSTRLTPRAAGTSSGVSSASACSARMAHCSIREIA